MHQPLHKSLWRRTRSLAPVGAIAVAALLVGCEDDENIPPGGTAGTSSGGTAGKSGAGNGGTAGTNAGNGGTAGVNAGGASGAGNGGTAGAGNGGTAGAGNGGTAGGGAGGSAGGTTCGDATGDGTLGTPTSVATGSDTTFVSPFDATPSPDGCTVYFTAVDAASGQGAVYSVAKDGTGIQRIDQNGMLVAPVGLAVSTDGKTLYIADAAYGSGTNDTGAILSLSTGGGSPSVVTAGRTPRSIAVVREGNADQVYFGATNDSGAASVFKAAAGSSTATEAGATTGGEVGGIASNDGTTIYLAAPDQHAVLNGTTKVVTDVMFGLASGVAVSTDGSAVLVATRNSAGASGILRVPVAGGTTSFKAIGTNLVEPAGLHRASNVEVYAFVDASGTNGAGSVWIAAK